MFCVCFTLWGKCKIATLLNKGEIGEWWMSVGELYPIVGFVGEWWMLRRFFDYPSV